MFIYYNSQRHRQFTLAACIYRKIIFFAIFKFHSAERCTFIAIPFGSVIKTVITNHFTFRNCNICRIIFVHRFICFNLYIFGGIIFAVRSVRLFILNTVPNYINVLLFHHSFQKSGFAPFPHKVRRLRQS